MHFQDVMHLYIENNENIQKIGILLPTTWLNIHLQPCVRVKISMWKTLTFATLHKSFCAKFDHLKTSEPIQCNLQHNLPYVLYNLALNIRGFSHLANQAERSLPKLLLREKGKSPLKNTMSVLVLDFEYFIEKKFTS